MFGRKKSDKEVDITNLNEVIGLTRNILKIAYILIAIIGVYAITMLFKEWNVLGFVFTVLKILAPLFIGIILAWLFDPIVRFLKQKGIKRTFGAVITYLSFIGLILILIVSFIPILTEQINELVHSLPTIFETIKVWIDGIFENLDKIENFNAASVKADLFGQIEAFGVSLAESLPQLTVKIIGSIFSGLGILIIGLIIGFYLLVSFDNVDETVITVLPKEIRASAKELFNDVNNSLRKFVQGTLFLSSIIFVVSSIGFTIAGLKAPLLFGLFCGLTNVIPYAGPYIGAIPAVTVAFSQDVTVGIFVLIVIAVVQFLEGNFLQPIIMSKTMKLHPVTIIVGLLVFGYFFGILGMIIATPLIAALKAVYAFFDNKYHFFKT